MIDGVVTAGAGEAAGVADMEVLDRGGHSLVVAWPGRVGLWSVGVPPSGPMDDWSFRLGNRLLGNSADTAGIECVAVGVAVRFAVPATVCVAGADTEATVDGGPVREWDVVAVPAGGVLHIGRIGAVHGGTRAYLLVRGGVDVPEVLGSRTTFDLGGFGGHDGRALATGDRLAIGAPPSEPVAGHYVPHSLRPRIGRGRWELAVLDGPQGAPDYLTDGDVELLYEVAWEVHHNSARTGVRLVGPRLTWARPDGGEAGLHPSNIHDNAYAVGTVDFTGDMPVVLGPDGPSLGGFVCPATVVDADLWKLGQLRPGDRVRFVPVSPATATAARREHELSLKRFVGVGHHPPIRRVGPPRTVLARTSDDDGDGDGDRPALTFRRSGDRHLLVEVGPPVLDLELRVRVQQLATWFEQRKVVGVTDLTPGIRSLQVQVDAVHLGVEQAIELVRRADAELAPLDDVVVPSRVVHLPLSWDDPAVRRAVDIYMRSVRPDAPWCPSNLEFIRRINGLGTVDEVRSVVLAADYVVYGLGDVYLGAPVATPLDPRHRLVTTKYNPARTWTPENAVGIGGAYLCVYGMEGPGGYQFVGRTTPVWRRGVLGDGEPPWLLRMFDRIRFHPVAADELLDLRADFGAGRWAPAVTDGTLSVAEQRRFLASIDDEATAVRSRQQAAFAAERARWMAQGELFAGVDADADAGAVAS